MATGGRAEGDRGLGKPPAVGEAVASVSLLVRGEGGLEEEEGAARGGGGPVGWSAAGCTTAAMLKSCFKMCAVVLVKMRWAGVLARLARLAAFLRGTEERRKSAEAKNVQAFCFCVRRSSVQGSAGAEAGAGGRRVQSGGTCATCRGMEKGRGVSGWCRAWGGPTEEGGNERKGSRATRGENTQTSSPGSRGDSSHMPFGRQSKRPTRSGPAHCTHTPHETPPDNQAWWSAGRAASEKGLGHLLQASIHEHGAVRM